MVNTIFRVVALATILAAVTVNTTSAQADGSGTWTGRVSDRKCGRNVDLECNALCIRNGVPPILVIDSTNELLSPSNPKELKAYGGTHVEVTGTRTGNVLNIRTVKRLGDSSLIYATPSLEDYPGDYRIAPGHVVGIDRFTMDDGVSALLFSDYHTGVVRRLYPVSDAEFTVGPGFAVASPVELTVRFVRNPQGQATAFALQPSNGLAIRAERMLIKQEPITVRSGAVTLSGTLLVPGTKGPHPAVVLLHGSGALTRFSFGPYPNFFASLGLAVFIYDKRGTGSSTGREFEHESYYPDNLANDALAVFQTLQHRADINPREIGFWGSSEGGMLATQVAARSQDIAFAINSSGFMMPLWQQALYNIGAELRAEGWSAAEVAEAVAFKQLQIRVMQTGQDWSEFRRMRARMQGKKWFAHFFGDDASVADLRWRWDHVYRFDAVPALKLVTCPLLGVFGERDTSTPAGVTVENMRRALSEAGNRDVTLRVFSGANHSLAAAQTGADDETPRLAGMANGVFDTLASWILARVHLPN